MAADIIGRDFTQVYNRAVRDVRLSRRARGLMVEILSHADGFGLSLAALVKAGPEGRDAIRTALDELMEFGYLRRKRERDQQTGQLGQSVYWVTDMPDGITITARPPWEEDAPEEAQTRRSEPSSGNPTQAEPTQADTPPKKNNHQKTKNNQNNKGVSRPSVPRPRASDDDAETDGRTKGRSVVKVEPTPGVDFLITFGAQCPDYVLVGKTLRDQGARVDGLLASGWTRQQIRTQLTARPLPAAHEIRTSAGAVISLRLRQMAASPLPSFSGHPEYRPSDHSSTGAADRSVDQAVNGRRWAECEGDDKMCRTPIPGGGRFCREHAAEGEE